MVSSDIHMYIFAANTFKIVNTSPCHTERIIGLGKLEMSKAKSSPSKHLLVIYYGIRSHCHH